MSAGFAENQALRRFSRIGVGAIVLVLSFLWLDELYPKQSPVSMDGMHDLLLSRTCYESDLCFQRGQISSFAGYYQGAVWNKLIVAVHLLGGDLHTLRKLILWMLALGVASLFVVTRRWLGTAVAASSALLLLAAYSSTFEPLRFVHPSPAFFPDALAAVSIFTYAMTGKRRFIVVSGFMTSVAVDTHIVAATLVPSLIVVACIVRPKPWLELALAAGTYLLTSMVTSRHALYQNAITARGLADWRMVVLGLAGLALVVLLGALFRRLRAPWRAAMVGIILCGPFVLGTAWVSGVRGKPFAWTYYWQPIGAPAAALVAGLTVAALRGLCFWSARARRWTDSIVVVLSLWLLLEASVRSDDAYRASPRQAWTFEDTRRVGDALKDMGWSYKQMLYRVQGPQCLSIVTGMGVFAAEPANESIDPFRHVQIRLLSEGAGAANVAGSRFVPLTTGEVAELRELRSWVDFGGSRVCRRPSDAADGERCESATPKEVVEPGRFNFEERIPELYSQIPPPVVMRLETPLRITPQEGRVIEFADSPFNPACDWIITRVDGVPTLGDLPARSVTILPSESTEARLIIEKRVGTPGCEWSWADDRYPPCLLERDVAERP
jgi:hypothetical protein